MTDPRRRIPGVDALLEADPFVALLARASRERVVAALRSVLADLRTSLDQPGGAATAGPPTDPAWYAAAVARAIDRVEAPTLTRVINATGVVLHTNLGRAPLAEPARRALLEASGYASVEYDLERGERGSRHDHCVDLLRDLTGAADAQVVNNNAAAVVLALNTLAGGREAVISRGELVEIGGSFRVPEIMARSGARIREVGSTNRTHVEDYRRAIGDRTGAVLKVHRSNFRLEGFTAEVRVEDLARLTREAGIPLLHDLGSGALLDMENLGLPHEPTAREALEAGADVVTMSGDKLLGGPQAGIILGGRDLVRAMRRNPLCRAVRPDKLTLAALTATLILYLEPERAIRDVPVLRMLAESEESLRERAAELSGRLRSAGVEAEPVQTSTAVGGGAYPGVELAGWAVAVGGEKNVESLAGRLREGRPAVVGRIRNGRLLLELRTIEPDELDPLVRALEHALRRRD